MKISSKQNELKESFDLTRAFRVGNSKVMPLYFVGRQKIQFDKIRIREKSDRGKSKLMFPHGGGGLI